MTRASLRIYPPIKVGDAELCFVRFFPGDVEGQATIRDLLSWMGEHNITAIDDGPERPRKPGMAMPTLDFDEALERGSLWFFVAPKDAVHMRLRWAEAIDQ